jgi:hypothetical protein
MARISGGEIIEDQDPCESCRRVLAAMSTEPGPDAFGTAFADCRMAACWHELFAPIRADWQELPI